jgi:protein-S-isoprenylcysteine O-methyltransferase Ste14
MITKISRTNITDHRERNMSNKKWNRLTWVCALYILIGTLGMKLVYDNENTRHIATPFLEGWGIGKIVYFSTLMGAMYLIILRTTRDSEPKKQVTRKTFIKAAFATAGVCLFVLAAQAIRS